jgi:methylated-DNA-[protein]-cysteine S-methyltransferase
MTSVVLTVELPPGLCLLTASPAGLTSVRLLFSERAGAADVGCAAAVDGSAAAAAAVLQEAERQLQAYFAGELRQFDLPLDLADRTGFQRRVLTACCAIPYGATASYGELAGRSGHPGAGRAVGQVMATNRLALIIPCHRVVGSDGRLTGYGGGLALKQALLALERRGGGWAEPLVARATAAEIQGDSAR